METIYRRIAPHKLDKAVLDEKLRRDADYENAVNNLSIHYYQLKDITEEEYKTQKAQLWADYQAWGKQAGLYQEVTPEEQVNELDKRLAENLTNVNSIRKELGYKEYTLAEKI